MLELKRPIKDAELLESIALRCSDCFSAMNIANAGTHAQIFVALGGSLSIEWEIVRTFSLVEMVKDAKTRGLDLNKLKVAVGDEMVVNTAIYKKADEKLKPILPPEPDFDYIIEEYRKGRIDIRNFCTYQEGQHWWAYLMGEGAEQLIARKQFPDKQQIIDLYHSLGITHVGVVG